MISGSLNTIMLGQIASGGGGGFLLDTYTGSARAYSSRQLRSAQTNCLIVRRSNDNATQTIGFVGGFLDTASILSFCGGNSGFVTTVFDQSGNGINATQTTNSLQPRICNSGVLDVRGLAGFGRFIPASDTRLLMTTGLTPTATTTVLSVAYQSAGGNRTILSGIAGAMQVGINASNQTFINRSMQVAVIASSTLANSRVRQMTFDNKTTLRTNGALLTSVAAYNAFTQPSGSIGLNLTNGEGFDDVIHELIVFLTDLSSTDLSAIEANQVAYFGIT